MSCPHGLHSTPTTCSQCANAPVRRVALVDGKTLVDGAPPPVRNVLTRQQQRIAKAREARGKIPAAELDAITDDVARAMKHLPHGALVPIHAEACPRYERKRAACTCASFIMAMGAKA